MSQQVVWLWQTLLARAIWGLTRRMSPGRAAQCGRIIALSLISILPLARAKIQNIITNLGLAFPEKSEREIKQLAREVWANLGEVFAEYPQLDKMQSDRRVEIVTKWNIDAWRRTGKPAIFVTAHLANWELTASSVVALGIPLTVIYKQRANQVMERMVQRWRRTLGCGFVDKRGAVRPLARCLKKGESIGLVTDTKVNDGDYVPFFGLQSLTTLVPARLALKLNYDMIPVRVERLAPARYRVTLHEPIRPNVEQGGLREQAIDMMRQVNELYEVWIRERPGQWNCTFRRWAKSLRPKFN